MSDAVPSDEPEDADDESVGDVDGAAPDVAITDDTDSLAANRPSASGDREPGDVHVVGTAHVSEQSVEEVEAAIDGHDPDVVAVELDEGRFRQLEGEAPEDLEARDLLRGNTVFQFLAYWMLSYVQHRLGEQFDIEPGADMKAAVDAARERGIDVALVDRDIQTTIQRFWARMTFLEKLKMVGHLVLAVFGLARGTQEEFDVDELTDTDVVTAMMEEFRRFSPGGAEALIDERDAYIAHRLLALRASGANVVAVVGAGHKAGIERYLADPTGLPPQVDLVGRESGRRFSIAKVVGYGVSLGVLTFFVLLAMAGVSNAVLFRVFAAWFAINAVFAFGLAKLAGARWLSAAAGGAVAWMTSINPLLAPGWFTGYVELRHTPVNVADIATLNRLMSDETLPIRELVGRMFEVPLFRLIVIVAMTNVGSMIASGLFVVAVVPWLGLQVGGVDEVSRLMVQGARNSADLIWNTVT